jgi:methylthioribose-1-phosphate isomerase
MSFYTIAWQNNAISMLDQRLLPEQEVYLTMTDYHEVARAIKDLVIRGAPAIGVACAYGLALGMNQSRATAGDDFWQEFLAMTKIFAATRPTAVNLFWAIKAMTNCLEQLRQAGCSIPEIKQKLIERAIEIHQEDIAINRQMGAYGSELLHDGMTVLTHCNAGALATGGYGTALGVIRAAIERNKRIQVFADETRPFLQGARLTAWELMKDNIPVTVITDNMAGYFMAKGLIQAAIVGADRIAANGDVANKIGTYSVAILCQQHNIPFYVAAPISTIDISIQTGEAIPIEERSADEVSLIGNRRLVPLGVPIRHPAFDTTPHRFIQAIITEKGVLTPPYAPKIASLFAGKR